MLGCKCCVLILQLDTYFFSFFLLSYFHIVIQLCTVLLGLTGFIIIVVYTVKVGGKQFDPQGFHRVLGLIITLLMMVQPFLGQLANVLFDPTRKKTPFWPDKLHWILGGALILFGIINIHLGLAMYCVTTRSIVSWIVAVCVIVLSFLTFDLLSWLCDWGGFLGGPDGAGHGSDSATTKAEVPRGLLIFFETLCWAAVAICLLITIYGIATQESGVSAPYYDQCSTGQLRTTGMWWLIFILGLSLIIGAACTSFAIWYMNVALKRTLTERRTRRTDQRYKDGLRDAERNRELRQSLMASQNGDDA